MSRAAIVGNGLCCASALIAGRKGGPVRAVPDGDAMAPPQLAADAPVADVFHPVIVDSSKRWGTIWISPAAHRFDGRFGQRLHLHPPLFAEQRLDHGVAALAVAHLVGTFLFPHHEAQLPSYLPIVSCARRSGPGRHTARRSR